MDWKTNNKFLNNRIGGIGELRTALNKVNQTRVTQYVIPGQSEPLICEPVSGDFWKVDTDEGLIRLDYLHQYHDQDENRLRYETSLMGYAWKE